MSRAEITERVSALCHEFRLPTVAREVCARFDAAAQGSALETLLEVLELEATDRGQRRVDRLLRASRLPSGKTFETLDLQRLGPALESKLESLTSGQSLDRAFNVLAFGPPGTGKSHSMCALGHRWVERGYSVLFVPAYQIVQDLQAAKRDLDLPRMLRKLDAFDVLILDDLGSLRHQPEESEVLFALISERYERRSLVLTSNVVFSQWQEIFHSPMATAAAIDRIVHHSTILEFALPSYRTECAQQGQAGRAPAPGAPASVPRRGGRPSTRAPREAPAHPAGGRTRKGARTMP